MKFNMKARFLDIYHSSQGSTQGVGVIGVYDIGIHPENVNKNAIK
jgi:hypothetical protein